MKHIKTPVEINGWGDINDADGKAVIGVSSPYDPAFAAELVCAVNAHDKLVDALRQQAGNYYIWKTDPSDPLCWCRGFDSAIQEEN
jgi:hypothetical protein